MVLQGIIEQGCGEEHHDLIDEMLRQLIKKSSYEKEGSTKGRLFGHPDVHRLLKDLVKQEAEQQAAANKNEDNEEQELQFSHKLFNTMAKYFDDVLKTRAVFILVEYIEHKETKEIVEDILKTKKKDIINLAKEMPASKGLQILVGKLQN